MLLLGVLFFVDLGRGKVFRVALAGQMVGLLSCLLFDETRVSCSEAVSRLMASISKTENIHACVCSKPG